MDVGEEFIVDVQVLKLSDSDISNENSFNGRLNISTVSDRTGISWLFIFCCKNDWSLPGFVVRTMVYIKDIKWFALFCFINS